MREKEGMALQSNEVVIAISIVATFVVLKLLGGYMLNTMGEMLTKFLSDVGSEQEFGVEFVQKTGLEIAKYGIMIVGPVAVIIGFTSIITVLAQTRGLFSMKAIRPKFSRLSPIQGAKRLFSMQSFVNVIKGMLELTIIGVIVYFQIKDRLVVFGKMPDMEPIQAVYYIASSVFDIVMLVFIVLAFVAAADFVFQWWQYEKKLKMSKQEVKDEYKQIEGDPQIKSKIKQKQREISQRRMMQDVPTSDVVVRNPTHYAVALKYESENALSAPRVVAKGMDALALKIVKVAEENDVYVTENRPLARSLYDSVQIGAEIPPELYSAVAVVLTEMFHAKGIKPVISNDTPDESRRVRRNRRAGIN
ncbi:MAG: flagellar biosynthesis protein FlhB [Ruminococcaceae bacterium]|nr:flagellar biosynthesis protein FlhB [Oscillospiraceae bacterium]